MVNRFGVKCKIYVCLIFGILSIGFLSNCTRKTDEEKPWAYHLAYGPPHVPEQCPQKFLDMFEPDDFTLAPDIEENLNDKEKLEEMENELSEIIRKNKEKYIYSKFFSMFLKQQQISTIVNKKLQENFER